MRKYENIASVSDFNFIINNQINLKAQINKKEAKFSITLKTHIC